MPDRRCGTCGLWCDDSWWPLNGVERGDCNWAPTEPVPVFVLRSTVTFESDGTDCPCWRPREEKGESDDE